MSQTDNVRRVESFKSNANESVEVSPPLRRRVWTSVAKLQVLKDIEVLKGHQGDIGAYLRQQGLFSSTVSLWRKLRDSGQLTLTHKKRGPQVKRSDVQKEVDRLSKENARLHKELEVSKKLIEIQKKIAQLMEDEK